MKALITGAYSGIGRDISKELEKRGYDLLSYHNQFVKI